MLLFGVSFFLFFVVLQVGRAIHVVSNALVHAGVMTEYNILQNNGRLAHQAVMHVHYHIIPKTEREGLDLVWSAGTPDKAALKELAAKIDSHIKSKV